MAFQTGNSITNSTFASNTATGFGGGGYAGDNTALVFDTFFGNSGPVLLRDGAGGNTLANSILADAPAAECIAGPVSDGGHNVASDATCAFGPNSIQNSTTIGTLTLAANGSTGPQTAAITRRARPRDSADAACTVTTDQRGQRRPGVGFTTCDAGAYETAEVDRLRPGRHRRWRVRVPGRGARGVLRLDAGPRDPHQQHQVGIVATNNYTGYNLAGSDGGVFVFPLGMPAGFYGSLPGLHVSVNNVVGLVGTNNNHGYNLVGSDGGVFVFPTGQSAGYYGSLPGLGVHINNIVGIVESPDGRATSSSDVTAGCSPSARQYYGSLPGNRVSVNNIVGIATTFDGKGYYLVGSDGSVYPFGDAVSHGSLPAMGLHVSNIVSVVPTADNGGYWLIGTDGGVFAFGDAGFIGSLPGLKVTPVSPIIGAVQTLS